MLQKFKQFPIPLQKQVLLRIGLSAAFVLLTILSIFFLQDWSTVLIGSIITAFCVFQALWVFHIADNQKYVVVSGQCCDMTLTPIKRRVKSLLLKTLVDGNEVFVRIMVRNRLKKFPTGSQLDVYVSENTMMHEKDGTQHLHGYLAICIVTNL